MIALNCLEDGNEEVRNDDKRDGDNNEIRAEELLYSCRGLV